MNTDSNIIGPINLGNPNEIQILELAEIILDLTNSKSKLTFEKLPLDDPIIRQPDISKAADNLGWKPKIDLKTGLLKTIEFFSSII